MQGELAALTAAFLWAWTATFFTVASRHIGSFAVNVYRIPLGLLLLALTYFLANGSLLVTPYQVLMLSLSGIVGLAIGDAFLFEAFVLIGPRLTMLIYTMSPAMTAVIAFLFLSERMGLMALGGMAVIMIGILWVLMDRNPGVRQANVRGVLYGLLGSLGQAIGLVLAKSALDTGIDALYATIIRMAAATLAMGLVVLVYRNPGTLSILRDKRRAILPLVGGVICGPYLGVWLSQVAIKLTLTGIAATLMAMVPVIIIPISAVVEKERITVRAILGALVAIAGVTLLFMR
ncbi:MAG TPA: DMT family transporter [Thermoanaerobaculia bacterium]|nr:DMT family transporter [Thermoanaerobaculia bacterium]HUM29146.1 DMT family transporter [Thermoanaerobaculia bacterium]HXK67523.1 DMT family transporter [Thermoanaerobaculia bacterium]